MDERLTCLTFPNSVLFKPRFFAGEPVMVLANCFNRPIDGVLPTANRTDDCTVVGGSTVDPFEFVRLMYKFCIPKKEGQSFQRLFFQYITRLWLLMYSGATTHYEIVE